MMIPTFDELACAIERDFAELRTRYQQWADLARQALQGLPHDAARLALLEADINQRRAALRNVVLVASEHLTAEQLIQLRSQAHMSKYAWKSLKKQRPVTIKSGFTLVSY